MNAKESLIINTVHMCILTLFLCSVYLEPIRDYSLQVKNAGYYADVHSDIPKCTDEDKDGDKPRDTDRGRERYTRTDRGKKTGSGY